MISHKQVLNQYLESLLSEVEAQAEVAGQGAVCSPCPVLVKPVPLTSPVLGTRMLPAAPPLVGELPVAEPVLQSMPETPEATHREAPQPPVWGRGPFQVLIVYVAGLKLAVPLVELCGISKGNCVVTTVPGQPTWYRGLVGYRGRQVGVIDTARLMMPERVRSDQEMESSHLLFLGGEARWSLDCEALGEVHEFEPARVNWKIHRGKRPWLAGTVVEEMCALLNVGALLEMVERERRQRSGAPSARHPGNRL